MKAPSATTRPRLSRHARQRWRERCFGLDPAVEFEAARRPGKVLRKKIREGCPGHANLMQGRIYRGFYYLVSKARVVFVVAGADDIVITVWRLPQPVAGA